MQILSLTVYLNASPDLHHPRQGGDIASNWLYEQLGEAGVGPGPPSEWPPSPGTPRWRSSWWPPPDDRFGPWWKVKGVLPMKMSQLPGWAGRAGTWLLDLLFPMKCPFCQHILEDSRAPACPGCQKMLPWLSGREAERPVEFTSGCLSPFGLPGQGCPTPSTAINSPAPPAMPGPMACSPPSVSGTTAPPLWIW